MVCAAQVLVQIGAYFWPALLPGMIPLWGLSNSEAGWVTAMFYGPYMGAVPVLVTLTDRVDPRRVYLFGVGCTVAAHLLFGLLATGLNLCSMLAVPSVMAFLPLYARSLNIDNIGFFYALAGVTSIVVRPVLGKKSDAMGRGPAIAVGLGSQFIGLALIIIARDLPLMLAGGFFLALGVAMIGSTTTALAMNVSA